MSEVTRILSAIDSGDPHAAAQLLPLVYDELRKLAAGHMANEAQGHTLDATALVHEAYLGLVANPGRESEPNPRDGFPNLDLRLRLADRPSCRQIGSLLRLSGREIRLVG